MKVASLSFDLHDVKAFVQKSSFTGTNMLLQRAKKKLFHRVTLKTIAKCFSKDCHFQIESSWQWTCTVFDTKHSRFLKSNCSLLFTNGSQQNVPATASQSRQEETGQKHNHLKLFQQHSFMSSMLIHRQQQSLALSRTKRAAQNDLACGLSHSNATRHVLAAQLDACLTSKSLKFNSFDTCTIVALKPASPKHAYNILGLIIGIFLIVKVVNTTNSSDETAVINSTEHNHYHKNLPLTPFLHQPNCAAAVMVAVALRTWQILLLFDEDGPRLR